MGRLVDMAPTRDARIGSRATGNEEDEHGIFAATVEEVEVAEEDCRAGADVDETAAGGLKLGGSSC